MNYMGKNKTVFLASDPFDSYVKVLYKKGS